MPGRPGRGGDAGDGQGRGRSTTSRPSGILVEALMYALQRRHDPQLRQHRDAYRWVERSRQSLEADLPPPGRTSGPSMCRPPRRALVLTAPDERRVVLPMVEPARVVAGAFTVQVQAPGYTPEVRGTWWWRRGSPRASRCRSCASARPPPAAAPAASAARDRAAAPPALRRGARRGGPRWASAWRRPSRPSSRGGTPRSPGGSRPGRHGSAATTSTRRWAVNGTRSGPRGLGHGLPERARRVDRGRLPGARPVRARRGRACGGGVFAGVGVLALSAGFTVVALALDAAWRSGASRHRCRYPSGGAAAGVSLSVPFF